MKRIEQYKKFFQLQIADLEKEYEQYARTPMNKLFAEGRAFYGEVRGITKSGNLLIGVSGKQKPRLKVPMTICILKPSCEDVLGTDRSKWYINSIRFRDRVDCHTSFSEILPIYYLNDNSTIGCEKVDFLLTSVIAKALEQKKHLQFVMLETLPPTELLRNLAEYIRLHPSDSDLVLEPKQTYDEWCPKELKSADNVADTIIKSVDDNGISILQGPPGTGKSYTIAQMIVHYAKQGKSICVTTQSNSSLISLIEQKPIKELLEAGKISKTNLTSEEKSKHTNLKPANKDLNAASGELLCSTYYTLSRAVNVYNAPVYDIIIIEEASQAYETAIAAFRKLGTKCLIVGDPMQLPPIVKTVSPDDYKGIDIDTQANGMMTYIRSTDIPSFRLTTSYRLTAQSAMQTGVFYSEHLTSIQTEKVAFEEFSPFFPSEGGSIIYQTTGSSSGILSQEALEVIKDIESTIRTKYPKRSLAILSPYVQTTKQLQQYFDYDEQPLDITIDTINRIQGLTVDYAIYYIPARNLNFALSENLFNVATSRSRSTTLIITDTPLHMMNIQSSKVRVFLSRCKAVNSDSTIIAPEEHTQQPQKLDEKSQVKVVGYIDPSTFERKKKEIVQGKENVYIIDTNVFVNCPDIISRIDKKYGILLSAKVIDELDKLKVTLDSNGQKSVQDALRNINKSFETRKLKMETADVSVLPMDFNKYSPDNQILSVALKHLNNDENPILLTSDNGLQLKAKGLGVTTITLKEVLKK